MAKNVGSLDKIFRLVAGLLLIVLPFVSGIAFFESSTTTLLSALVGAVLVGTALFNFCPIYRILGIRTNKVTTTAE